MQLADNKMTIQEIADLVGVTAQTVYLWARGDKHLTWHRSPNNRFFALKDEVEDFAENYIGRGRPRTKAAN